MQHLYESLSYLQGLADGLDVSEDSKEGKMLLAMMDVLEDMAEAIVEISDEQDEMYDYVDALDDGLTEVEEELFDDEYHQMIDLECPECGEQIGFNEELLYDNEVEIACPCCGEVIIEAADSWEEDETDEQENK